VQITVPFSKTSLKPVTVSMIPRDDAICPLRALTAYARHFRQRRLSNEPYFKSDGKELSRNVFVAVVKGGVSEILYRDSSVYSGHSFRRGGTTAMYEKGVPEALIAAHGRWLSLTHRQYMQFDGALMWQPTLWLWKSNQDNPSNSN